MASELLETCFRKISLSDEHIDVVSLINTVIQNTCQLKKCLSSWENLDKDLLIIIPAKYIDSLSIESLLKYFDEFFHNEENLEHIVCTVKLLHIIYKNIMKHMKFCSGDDILRCRLITLCEKCLLLPDVLTPIPLDVECEGNQKYDYIVERNIALTSAIFCFYLDIVFSEWSVQNDCNRKASRVNCFEDISDNEKYIIKKTAPKAFVLACIRLGGHQWTNNALRKYSNDIIHIIKVSSQCETISNLLSGVNSLEGKILFPSGLFSGILKELTPLLQKDKWKKNMPSIHALVWCLMKVNFPHLSEHISKILPPLLMLSDDYLIDHKQLGIKCLQHLIVNVNPADLRLYNHADVIYDALFQQLYSNKYEIYQVLLTCLIQILTVLEGKPSVVNDIKYSRWDTCLEKLIQNFDMVTGAKAQLILLEYFPKFIEKMGANIIKHFDMIINLVGSSLHFGGQNTREYMLYLLYILSSSIKVCWPVINGHKKKLMKIVMKILIDINGTNILSCDAMKRDVEEEVYNVLLLIKLASNSDVGQSLSKLLQMELIKQFESIRLIIQRVLDAD